MTVALPGLGVLAGLDAEQLPVWGIDPSTVRMSVGILLPDGTARAETLSLPSGTDTHRFSRAYEELYPFLSGLARVRPPRAVSVEQPFAKGRNVPPVSQQMVGVLMAAVGAVLPATPIDLISPPSWKARALGKGHGMAKPPEYLAWAQQELGYAGSLEDEAAALGIAVARAVVPLPRILRGS